MIPTLPASQTTDQLALHSDRWLFLFALVVLGFAMLAVARYFVREHERLIEDHKEAQWSYQESLRLMVAEQSAANGKLVACLERNTLVLEECRDELRASRIERKRT